MLQIHETQPGYKQLTVSGIPRKHDINGRDGLLSDPIN